jgi:hypothetical protein
MPGMRALVLSLLLSTATFAQTANPAPKAAKPAPTLRSVLLAQLHSTHDKEEWFVPIDTAVAGLTPEQAKWIPKSEGPNNPAPADHSVGMITNHLLFWNSQSLAKLKGEKGAAVPADNSETFNNFDASTWPATAQKLDQVMTEIEHLVETATDEQLAKWADGIAHISAHNAYHVGQIVYVRKLQGSWDPAKGVK